MIFQAQMSRLVAADSRRFMHKTHTNPNMDKGSEEVKTKQEEMDLTLIQLLCVTQLLHRSTRTHTHTYTQTDRHMFTSQADQHNPGISIQREQITAIKISKCSCSLGHRVKLLKTLLTWWSCELKRTDLPTMQDYCAYMHVYGSVHTPN